MTMTREMLLSIAQASNGLAMAEEFANDSIKALYLDGEDEQREQHETILKGIVTAQKALFDMKDELTKIIATNSYPLTVAKGTLQ